MALDIAAYEDALRFLNRALADDSSTKGVRALKGYTFVKLGQPDHRRWGSRRKNGSPFPRTRTAGRDEGSRRSIALH